MQKCVVHDFSVLFIEVGPREGFVDQNLSPFYFELFTVEEFLLRLLEVQVELLQFLVELQVVALVEVIRLCGLELCLLLAVLVREELVFSLELEVV